MTQVPNKSVADYMWRDTVASECRLMFEKRDASLEAVRRELLVGNNCERRAQIGY